MRLLINDYLAFKVRMVPKNRWLIVISVLAFVTGWIFMGSIIVSEAAEIDSANYPEGDYGIPSRERGDNYSPLGNPLLLQTGQDLSIEKVHAGEFEIGSDNVFTITVSNVGQEPVTGSITVTDILTSVLTPIAIQGADWDPCGFSDQVLTCVYSNTGGLDQNQILPPILFTVTLGQIESPLVTNTATVSNTNDINLNNNVAEDIGLVASADLEVSKTVVPTTPAENETVSYTLVVTNTGPADASNVVLTDTLPSGITYNGSQPSQGTYNSSSGRWSVGNLTNGSTATMVINATVNPNSRGTIVVNTTEGLSSDLSDPDDGNNIDSASFEVLTARVLGMVTDAVTEDPIEDVLLSLTDSAGSIYTTTTVVSGWYTFTSTITEPLEAGGASLVVSKDGYATETKTFNIISSSDNRHDFALDTSDLTVSKDDGRTQVTPGQIITYTIGITNVGSIAATNIVITDELSANMTYITDTLGITHTEPMDDVFVWEMDEDLDPGEGITFTLRARIDTALPSNITVLTNQIVANTDSPEANLTNNSAEDSNKSTGSVDIGITKSINTTQFRVGENATFTIRVTNDGSAPATDLVITDNFSLYLDIVNASSNRGETTTNSTTRRVTVEIDDLDPDETATITVRVRANSRTTTDRTETNRASIDFEFGGDNFDENSNTVSYRILASSTLPGTGISPIISNARGDVSTLITVAMLGAILLALIGFIALGYGLVFYKQNPDWSGWSIRMGILLNVVALGFALLSWGVRGYSLNGDGATGIARYSPASREGIKASPTRMTSIEGGEYIWPSEPASDEFAVLPDFPVPTPTVQPTPDEQGQSPDISAVTRIVIPVLQVDAQVKYVPFDGLTWMIKGLRHEVAWMGDTSWPGLGGNTVLAGHVTLQGGEEGPFRYLELLESNDRVLVYTEENMYTYRVGDRRVVKDTDLSVVATSEKSQLTLITCTGWDENVEMYMKRLVVNADLVTIEALPRRAQGF